MQGLMNTKKLAEYLDVSPRYIDYRRSNGDWKEGIHWVYLNPKYPKRGVRYFPELCLNWIFHQAHPKKHDAYIVAFQRLHKLTA